MKIMMLLATLLLSACSTASIQDMFESKPEYSTTYAYTDPDTQQGKTSAMQCQMTQAQCEQMLEMKAESCVAKKDREIADCKAKGNAYCPDDSGKCKADMSSCTEKYNRCFQMAGGKFQLETKCVANCEKVKK